MIWEMLGYDESVSAKQLEEVETRLETLHTQNGIGAYLKRLTITLLRTKRRKFLNLKMTPSTLLKMNKAQTQITVLKKIMGVGCLPNLTLQFPICSQMILFLATSLWIVCIPFSELTPIIANVTHIGAEINMVDLRKLSVTKLQLSSSHQRKSN